MLICIYFCIAGFQSKVLTQLFLLAEGQLELKTGIHCIIESSGQGGGDEHFEHCVPATDASRLATLEEELADAGKKKGLVSSMEYMQFRNAVYNDFNVIHLIWQLKTCRMKILVNLAYVIKH